MHTSLTYVDPDPRGNNFIDEEDLLEYVEASILNSMIDYDESLEEAKKSMTEYLHQIVEWAVEEISSGKVRSIYDE